MSSAVAALSHDRRIAEALLEISHAVGSVMELPEILQIICEIGARVMETDTCSVYLLSEEEPDWLELAATKGLSRAEELGVRGFKWGDGVPGWAAANNQTVALGDASHDPRYSRLDDTKEEVRFMAYLCTPLRIQEDVVGIMSIRRTVSRAWTAEEILFAEIVAKQAAIVIEKARLYHQKVDAERLAAIAVSLSEVAHYIKNLLQTQISGSYMLDRGIQRADLDVVRKGWEVLQRSTTKIRTLVENMLSYSRETSCELESGDLNAVVREVAAEIRGRTEDRGITYCISFDDRIPPVMIDSMAFQDALLNLAANGVDAIPEEWDGELAIWTEWDEERHRARVLVRDNGAGIPADIQKKIFNLFFSTKGRGGTGIGLAATRKIVDEHKGVLDFHSEEGRGTTFVIELPPA